MTRTFCVCDRCGREMAAEDDVGEWEERVSVAFRAGYHSVFGDGNLVEGDFCQHCLRDLLGAWLRVTADDPSAPRRRPAWRAAHAYQDYQMRRIVEGRIELDRWLGSAAGNEDTEGD